MYCGAEVYFHTNGNEDLVVFDELGPPWPKHQCYEGTEPDDGWATPVPRRHTHLQGDQIRAAAKVRLFQAEERAMPHTTVSVAKRVNGRVYYQVQFPDTLVQAWQDEVPVLGARTVDLRRKGFQERAIDARHRQAMRDQVSQLSAMNPKFAAFLSKKHTKRKG